jgi:acid phosphatase
MLSTFILSGLLATLIQAAPTPDVDTSYPYTGPAIPVADPVNSSPVPGASIKGFPRLYEKPAVRPLPGVKVTNNINVISTAFFPGGINIHFQTPFDIGGEPCVNWGTSKDSLSTNTKGYTRWYV